MASDSLPVKPSKPAAKSTGKNARTAKKAADDEDEEDIDDMNTAAPEASGSDLSKKLTSVGCSVSKNGKRSELMFQMTAERDRLRKQRDEVSKHFENLTRIRNTDTEKLFERYRETAETAAKGQLWPLLQPFGRASKLIQDV